MTSSEKRTVDGYRYAIVRDVLDGLIFIAAGAGIEYSAQGPTGFRERECDGKTDSYDGPISSNILAHLQEPNGWIPIPKDLFAEEFAPYHEYDMYRAVWYNDHQAVGVHEEGVQHEDV